MRGEADVIKLLNEVLTAELTAVNQYFIHAMMCRNWHYMKLAEHSRKESIEEMKHAQELIERILYLEGVPNMQRYFKIQVGQTVPDQHRFDLEVERTAVERLNAGLEACRAKGDNGSRLLLEKILKEEEEHIDWLEAQLGQIEEIGLPNYLAQQIED
ncbi:MAG TPA: bacterioferritin [Thermoanaerobaculia bacterium]|nr:bacterioferritin [Thermoanaerobaculia bacterium]